MTGKHYIGETGTEILLDTKTDITAATDTRIKCKKPGGTIVEWAAAVKDTTKLSYITSSGDFDQAGVYRVQASLTLGFWSGLGEAASFKVLEAFEG